MNAILADKRTAKVAVVTMTCHLCAGEGLLDADVKHRWSLGGVRVPCPAGCLLGRFTYRLLAEEGDGDTWGYCDEMGELLLFTVGGGQILERLAEHGVAAAEAHWVPNPGSARDKWALSELAVAR